VGGGVPEEAQRSWVRVGGAEGVVTRTGRGFWGINLKGKEKCSLSKNLPKWKFCVNEGEGKGESAKHLHSCGVGVYGGGYVG